MFLFDHPENHCLIYATVCVGEREKVSVRVNLSARCLYVHPSLCQVCPSICLSVRLFVHPYVFLSILPSVCPLVCSSILPSACLSVHLSLSLPFHLSILLSICLYLIYLSLYMSSHLSLLLYGLLDFFHSSVLLIVLLCVCPPTYLSIFYLFILTCACFLSVHLTNGLSIRLFFCLITE